MQAPQVQAEIKQIDSDFVVVVDGEIIRRGFTGIGHAAAWAAKRGLYRGTTKVPRARVPGELQDESIQRIRLLATMSGTSYRHFLAEARRGVYGPLYKITSNAYGLKYGNWRRAMEARIVK